MLTAHGYRLVSPPLIEYTESLLNNADEDLKRQTFKFIDQPNGRLMGLRADITPQILRIDSKYGQGISRYCYVGQVVKPYRLVCLACVRRFNWVPRFLG